MKELKFQRDLVQWVFSFAAWPATAETMSLSGSWVFSCSHRIPQPEILFMISG